MAGQVCSQCSTENPIGARFCMDCGSPLERRCAACGDRMPEEARFCPSCGTEQERRRAVPPPVSAVPAEERRQVTVLFADLSGYTAVAERMDPESVKTVVERCLRRLGQEVEQYGGTVDKYIGDNVMALFGAPVAHEDDGERAVRAALGMQHAMEEINADAQREYGVSFALRVGLNTGEVLAGAVGDAYTVTGDTVNVAARLQAAGRPGAVTVGERTVRATRDAVRYEEIGPLELKGKSEPVVAWEAVGLLAAQPLRRVRRREAPLVGRDGELAELQAAYARVTRDGRPQLVTVVGQAGVGKSRLARELAAALDRDDPPPELREGRCLPYGSGIVYWPLTEILRAECRVADGDDADLAWSKLSARLAELLAQAPDEPGAEPAERKVALIARLLGIGAPPPEGPGEATDPQRARENFFSAVRSVIEAMALRRPLVLVLEDIHWADSGMLDLVEYLAQWVRAPVLIVALARDELLERRPTWGGARRRATSVFLDPLTREQTEDLVEALMPGAGATLPPAVAERAGGNPFFAEEIVRLLGEEGAGDTEQLPHTVQALLAARLDSLDPFERRIVQQAAVVGRTFWRDALEPVAAEEDRDLREALISLQEKDIVVPESSGRLAGEPALAFKHVLIRDVAYQMLPKSVRARKHREVGDFIERRAGDRSDEVVALLAEHYGRAATLAGEARLPPDELTPIRAKAVRFLEAAGDAAATLYSNREAFSHYGSARDLAVTDEEARARIGEKQGDVALRLGRVDAAISVWEDCLEHHRGREDLKRVADLHRRIGAGLWHKGERKPAIEHHQKGINLLKDGPPAIELVRLYEEAAWLYMQTGDNMLAIYAAEKSLRLAERLGETRAASRAHGIFGRVFGRMGDAAKARENLERAVELARGSDESEAILALLALGHHLEVFEADYPAAQEAYADALSQAERLGDVPAAVELQSALAQLAAYRADWADVERASDAGAQLAEREGLVGKLCLPYALRALLRWRAGEWDEAERLFRRSHELAEQVGWSEVAFSALFGLAVTLRDRGDTNGAVTALDQALDVCERAGLIAQSIQAISARAVTLALAGRDAQARETAEEAVTLSERLHYATGRAAALEADGATTPGQAGVERLREARASWSALGRPLDAARCSMLIGRALSPIDPAAATAALDSAREEWEGLGVGHQARRVRELAS
jgi:class 3 adenylate cyclase/tetratricopeptide (TPR) repeat protein/type II secretory pathway predicted ATPase ExeA